MNALDDDLRAELRAEARAERRRLRPHWCDVCRGHTGPGSPCATEPEDDETDEQGASVKKTITIEATVPAYLMPHHRVTTLLERARSGKPCTDMLAFWTFAPGKDYTRLGEAHIRIELGTEDEMVQAQIAALKSEIDAARAAFHETQRKIMEEISKLSAIEYVQEAS